MSAHRKDKGDKEGLPWPAYLDSIRYRYPYVLPPAIIKARQTITVDGKKVRISSGSYHGPSGKVLKRRFSRGKGRQ